MRDVYVVNDFTGAQLGTKEQPYSVRTAREFDALMQSLQPNDHLAHHWHGRFATKGSYRWGDYSLSNWRAGKCWTIDGEAEISLEPLDSEIDAQPLFVIAWHPDSLIPRASGITVNANHSALADRFWAKGKSLRTGGVLQYGQGHISVTFRNCGAMRAPGQPKEVSSETFVAEIIGGGSITGSVFKDHDLASTDDQVSVFRIMASENGEKMSDVPCLMERNTTHAPGSKLVQAHTIYGLPGVVRHNKQVGGYSHYYGDYFVNKGPIDIRYNEASDVIHGVVLKLSPGEFSHANVDVGPNKFASSGANVLLDPIGPMTPTRYIRGIKVDASLSVLNRGAEFTFTGVDRSKARGCFR